MTVKATWKRFWRWFQRQSDRPLRRLLLTVLFLGPAVAVIAYRTYQNRDVLRDYAWRWRPGFWGIALLSYSLALFAVLWAWNTLMGHLTGSSRFPSNARIYCLTNLSKRIPGPFWYLLGRVYFYRAEGVRASATLAATALEQVFFALTGMMVYFLTLPFSGRVRPLHLGVAAAIFFLALLLLQPPIFNRAARFLLRRAGSDARVQITYRLLLPVTVAYLLGWILPGLGLYGLAASIYPLPWSLLQSFVGMWAVSGTLSLLLSTVMLGSGVREVALSFLLVPYMPQPIAVVVAVLFWFIVTVGEVLWAGIFALLGRRGVRAGFQQEGVDPASGGGGPPVAPGDR